MKNKSKIILIGLVLAFIPSIPQAQTKVIVNLKKIKPEPGVSSYNISRLREDKKGFIWMATQDGLKVFDGTRFRTAGNSHDIKLGGSAVFDLTEDTARNKMWVASSYGGLDAIDISTYKITDAIKNDAFGKELKNSWIRSACIANDILWFGTSSGINAYHLSKNTIVPVKLALPGTVSPHTFEFTKILRVNENYLLALLDGIGIISININTFTAALLVDEASLKLKSSTGSISFWDATQIDDQVIISSSYGLRVLRPDQTGQLLLSHQWDDSWYANEEIFCCLNYQNRYLYFANTKSLYRLDVQTRQLSVIEDDDQENNWQTFIYALYADRRDNIWIGTQQGLEYLSPGVTPFTSYFKSRDGNQKIRQTYSVFPVSDQQIIAGAEDGLFFVDNLTKDMLRVREGSSYSLICPLPDKNLLISCAEKLLLYRNNGFVDAIAVYPELAILKGDLFSSGITYNDSLVVLGSERATGFYLWNTRAHTVNRYSNDVQAGLLKNNVINSIYRDRQHKVWVISEDRVVVFDPLTKSVKAVNITRNGKIEQLSILMDICQVRDHYFLLAYGTGLIMLNKDLVIEKIFSVKEGISNAGVYRIFPAGDTSLFITTNNGLSVFNINNRSFKNYYESSGLHSNGFEEGCGAFVNGKIYAGGVNGFTIIDPAKFSSNPLPPVVYINRFSIQLKDRTIDSTNLDITKMVVPQHTLQLSLYLSAIGGSGSHQNTFSYKIRELTDDWINIGAQDFIPLIGFAPGTYHLQLRAFNEDGVPGATREIVLVFQPKWYQTWWFKSLLLLFAAGMLYAAYRIRIYQIRKEERIRRQLASDLHDDLGSTMNSVKAYANLALMDRQEKYLVKIKESTQEAILGIRDMIWVLDDSKDSVEHLVTRVNNFAGPLCEVSNISYQTEIDDLARDHRLRREEKRNLYMMLKEAVNNSVKYSSATSVAITVMLKKNKLQLQVKDNGAGFDTTLAQKGNGLANMRRRALETNYRFQVQSSPGEGVTIEFQEI